LSAILVLIIFISVMGYLIAAEVNKFWLGMGKNTPVKTEGSKLI
jgi:hypothetical protein